MEYFTKEKNNLELLSYLYWVSEILNIESKTLRNVLKRNNDSQTQRRNVSPVETERYVTKDLNIKQKVEIEFFFLHAYEIRAYNIR